MCSVVVDKNLLCFTLDFKVKVFLGDISYFVYYKVVFSIKTGTFIGNY